jgi:hypothetical protein
MSEEKTPAISLIGETLVITATGAVLYFWGIIYYMQLTESLGLGISLFSISVYEVIVAPWDNAIWVILWTVLLWVLWHQKHIYLVIAFYTLTPIFIPLALCVKIASRSKAIRWFIALLGDFIKKALSLLRKIPQPSDELLSDLNNPLKDRRMFIATFHAIVVFVIIGTGLYMPSKAKARVKAHLDSTNKSFVEVVCEDGATVRGEYILALGDAIVIDLEETGQPMRVLIKQAQIKRIIKLLPKKHAAVAKEPSSQTTITPAPVMVK